MIFLQLLWTINYPFETFGSFQIIRIKLNDCSAVDNCSGYCVKEKFGMVYAKNKANC